MRLDRVVATLRGVPAGFKHWLTRLPACVLFWGGLAVALGSVSAILALDRVCNDLDTLAMWVAVSGPVVHHQPRHGQAVLTAGTDI